MKRIFLYSCGLVVLGLFLAAMAASCSVGPTPEPPGPVPPPQSMVDVWTGTPLPEFRPTNFPLSTEAFLPAPTLMPSFTPEGPERFNYLVLGGDMGPGRPKPVAGGAGNKTDVILLVSVVLTEPAQVTIVQFPRNFYSALYNPDRLLFEVYWQDGFEGMRTYFGDVFGVELDGIAYVDMPHFVEYVNVIGGVETSREAEGCEPGMEFGAACHFDGAQLLAWLRDNDNNWEHGVYDAGMRQHRALVAILDKVYAKFADKDLMGVFALFDGVETDLGVVQFVNASFVGMQAIQHGMTIDFDRLAYPTIQRGSIPIEPWRAEVANGVSLRDWMAAVLSP